MYLRYNGEMDNHECAITSTGEKIQVTFQNDFQLRESGFKVYSDSGKLVGDYSEYVYIIESHADGCTFSKQKGEETTKKEKTLGQRLEEAENKCNELENELAATKEALEATNDALESFLFDYIFTSNDAEEGDTSE